MKHLAIFSLLSFTLFNCKNAETTSLSADTTVVSESVAEATSDPVVEEGSLDRYKNELESLPMEPESALAALNFFKDEFNKDDSLVNDQALGIYFKFQRKLIEALNNRLMESSDYEEINSLAYADTAQQSAVAFSFEKKIIESGLAIAFEEGSVFIDAAPGIISEYFYDFVTSGTQMYLKQFEIEMNQISAADAGIIIPMQEFADRLGRWDTFIKQYPNNIFNDDGRRQLKFYRYYFLVGMDNTPAFDYESNRLSQEFMDAYAYFLKQYPSTSSSTVVRNYLDHLKKADYIKTEEVEKFAAKYSPYENQ
jgi:hypothetical protein